MLRNHITEKVITQNSQSKLIIYNQEICISSLIFAPINQALSMDLGMKDVVGHSKGPRKLNTAHMLL